MTRVTERPAAEAGGYSEQETGGEAVLPPVHRPSISLDPRLSLIAELVGACDCCADIGCDHGRLGAYLLQTGRCRRVQLLDISEPSLAKARRLIGLLNLSQRADFGVGDGTGAMTGPADVVVIAGMGGATIAGIVESDQNRLGSAKLILQPNVAAPELRATLARCGWRIADERVARDGRRNYVVIVAERGKADYSMKQLVVGPVLLERMPAELAPYAAFRLRVARKALAGAQAGGDAAQRAALEQEIEIWEEVSACLKRSETSSSC